MDYFVAYAQTITQEQTFDGILSRIFYYVINPAIVLLFTIATVVFIWGVIKYIKDAGDSTKRAQGQQHMLWGVIGFVIMLSIYGIIQLLVNFFGITGVKVDRENIQIKPQKIDPIEIRPFQAPKTK